MTSDFKPITDLTRLVDAIVTDGVSGPVDGVTVTDITADSRRIVPGALFVAVRGTGVDGHTFIPAAVKAGAGVIVAEHFEDDYPGVTCITVPDSAVALGYLASRYYGDPSRRLQLVGVTGTNGKTTIATLMYDMARLHGETAGLLSTVVNRIDTRAVPATHTTPDPLELNRLLREMVDAGCTFAAMEVSSHASAQHRIAGLHFAGGVFTNLTRDHLDYHKTVQAYLAAKKAFFDGLPSEAFALTNADDRNGAVMVQNTAARPVTCYSVRGEADFRVRVLDDTLEGMTLEINGREVHTMFVGHFNASNLAAVYGAMVLSGYDPEEVLVNLSLLRPVAGRLQTFRSATGITAIVDYAHTPDALHNVLETLNEIDREGGRIITVCGCGGNRDAGKRPQMALEAATLSDRVILTSDNPRDEDPEEILAQMRAGLTPHELARTETITDRREAIRAAVAMAAPGDIILVAGKGHEDYQIIRGVKHHFDDREEVCRALGIPTAS